MSRSNPQQNARNPSTRWFEWHGSKGHINFWDKEAKKRVDVALPFTFLLLDELATVRGFHERSQSGIFANEVRDTRQETLLVKAFEGGEIASGLYAGIRDRVKAHGGYFQASCYVAYKDGDALKIGNLGLNGAALSEWSEFKKRASGLYDGAVSIVGYEERTHGATKYRVPKFALKATTPETNEAAKKLDTELQTFLAGYLKQPRTEQAAKPAVADEEPPVAEPVGGDRPLEDDDIPF